MGRKPGTRLPAGLSSTKTQGRGSARTSQMAVLYECPIQGKKPGFFGVSNGGTVRFTRGLQLSWRTRLRRGFAKDQVSALSEYFNHGRTAAYYTALRPIVVQFRGFMPQKGEKTALAGRGPADRPRLASRRTVGLRFVAGFRPPLKSHAAGPQHERSGRNPPNQSNHGSEKRTALGLPGLCIASRSGKA